MSRDATLNLIGSGTGKRQTDRDTPMPLSALDSVVQITSRNWYETAKTIEEILDCIGEEIVSKEVTRVIYRLPIEGDFTAKWAAIFAAYGYGVAAAPSGATQNTRGTVSVTGAPTGGGYRLLLTYDGIAARSGLIPPGATLAQIKAIVEAMDNIGYGNTIWTGAAPNYTYEFTGKRAAASIPAFTKDVTGLIGGTSPDVAIAVTQVGSQRAHNITRIPGYQTPYTTFGLGFADVPGSERLLVGVVIANLRVRGGVGNGKLTFTADLIIREVQPGIGLTFPACDIKRPMRTGDCKLVVGGIDITDVLTEFETALIDNATLQGDSAYTARGSIRPSRLERATRRRSSLNFRTTGEVTDAFYAAAEIGAESGLYYDTSLRLGTDGEGLLYGVPNGILELDGTGVEFAGDNRETRTRYVITPAHVGIVLPTNIVAHIDQSSALLIAA